MVGLIAWLLKQRVLVLSAKPAFGWWKKLKRCLILVVVAFSCPKTNLDKFLNRFCHFPFFYCLTFRLIHFVFQEMNNFGFVNTDVAFNVLSRLPTKLLLGIKCVCKGWYQLLSNHDFMKVQSQKREPISGFFFQQMYKWCPDDIRIINYIPAESEYYRLNQTVFSFLSEDVVLLASCNGLVCCRSCVPFNDPAIYVCNPINKEWIMLKWTRPDIDSHLALAFGPCQDPERSINFKLVQVHHFEVTPNNLCFSFDIYASDTESGCL